MDWSFKYFIQKEFSCNCGCGKSDISHELVKRLDRIRVMFGKPITITSGCRCAEHNKAVGGKPDSSHLSGLASDIGCNDFLDRYELLILCLLNFARVGIGKDFIHVDIDEEKSQNVCWVY